MSDPIKLKHDTTVSCLGVGTVRHGTITTLPESETLDVYPVKEVVD